MGCGYSRGYTSPKDETPTSSWSITIINTILQFLFSWFWWWLITRFPNNNNNKTPHAKVPKRRLAYRLHLGSCIIPLTTGTDTVERWDYFEIHLFKKCIAILYVMGMMTLLYYKHVGACLAALFGVIPLHKCLVWLRVTYGKRKRT